MIHTGDISHLSKASEFDDAERIISQAKLDVHYVPGEHDFLDEEIKFYKDRYGKGTRGAGYYSFDANGVHFIGLVNVVDLKAGGLGNLGAEQLEWLEQDLKGRSKSTPIVVFAHIPLWTVYPEWGWGTEDGARALEYLKGFGSVTVLNGHIHQVMQKVEGNVTFHTARSTAFPQPAPGTAPSPGPMKVADDKLRTMLGTASINFKRGERAPRDHRHAAGRLNEGPKSKRQHKNKKDYDDDIRNVCAAAAFASPPRPRSPFASARRSCRGVEGDDRQLHLLAGRVEGEGRRHRDLEQPRRHSAHRGVRRQVQVEGDGYRRHLLLHLHDGRRVQVFLFAASAHDRDDQG